MVSLWQAYRTQVKHAPVILLLALLLLVPLTPTPPSLFTSLNLGIPDAALHSPIKGPLPDTTVLTVGFRYRSLRPNLANLDQAEASALG